MKRYIGISLLTIATVFGMALVEVKKRESHERSEAGRNEKTNGGKEQSEQGKEQSEKGKEVKQNVTYAKAPLEIQNKNKFYMKMKVERFGI